MKTGQQSLSFPPVLKKGAELSLINDGQWVKWTCRDSSLEGEGGGYSSSLQIGIKWDHKWVAQVTPSDMSYCACRLIFVFSKWCDSTFKKPSLPGEAAWQQIVEPCSFMASHWWPDAMRSWPFTQTGLSTTVFWGCLLYTSHFLSNTGGFGLLTPPLPALLAWFPLQSLGAFRSAPGDWNQAVLGSWIRLVGRPSNSCSALPQLPGRVQPPWPICKVTALRSQGHLGDTKHLSCATTWQA